MYFFLQYLLFWSLYHHTIFKLSNFHILHILFLLRSASIIFHSFTHTYALLCTDIFLRLLLVRVCPSGNKRSSLRLCLPGFLGVIRIGWRTTIKVKYWPSWRERAVGISFAGGLNSDHRSHSCELLIAVWLAGSLTPQIEPSIRSRKDGRLGGVCFTVYRLISRRDHKTSESITQSHAMLWTVMHNNS